MEEEISRSSWISIFQGLISDSFHLDSLYRLINRAIIVLNLLLQLIFSKIEMNFWRLKLKSLSSLNTQGPWFVRRIKVRSYSSLATPIDCWSNCVTVDVRFTLRNGEQQARSGARKRRTEMRLSRPLMDKKGGLHILFQRRHETAPKNSCMFYPPNG